MMSQQILTEPLPWHQLQWQFIQSAIDMKRLPSAILLHGEEGVGKSIFAQQLAAYCLCKSPNGLQACGRCDSCQQRLSLNHPDLYTLTISDKQKSIGIDDIRQVSNRLQQSSHQQGKQVVIINPCSALTLAASHAFLKTLEEPMGDVLFILVLSQPQTLLPTIMSRVVALPFNNVAIKQDELERLVADPRYVSFVAALYQTSPYGCEEAIARQEWVLGEKLLDHVGKSLVPKISALSHIEKEYKEKELLSLQILYVLFRDLVKVKLGGEIEQLAFSFAPQKIAYMAKQLSLLQCYDMVRMIGKAIQDMHAATSFNAMYLLEAVFLACQKYSLENKKLIKESLC